MEIYVENPKQGSNQFKKVGPAFSYPLRGKVTLLDKLVVLSNKHKGMHYLLFGKVEEALFRGHVRNIMSELAPEDRDEILHFLQSLVCRNPNRLKSLNITTVKIKIDGSTRIGFAFNSPTK